MVWLILITMNFSMDSYSNYFAIVVLFFTFSTVLFFTLTQDPSDSFKVLGVALLVGMGDDGSKRGGSPLATTPPDLP